MNCNKTWRYNGLTGSLVPGAMGLQDTGAGYSPMQPGMSEGDEYADILALSRQAGAIPTAGQGPAKKKFDWGQLAQMGAMGAMAGMGGKSGMAMAPIMALLMQLPQFKKLTSARTPGFNPNAKTPMIDDGRQGG